MELSPSSEDNKISGKETGLENESQSNDTSNSCTCTLSDSASTVDSEDIRIIVRDVLDSLINQIAEYENSHVDQHIAKSYFEGTPVVVRDSVTNRDLHSVSPTSEDSGIGCSLSHAEDTKDSDLVDHSHHRHDHFNDSTMAQVLSDSAKVEHEDSESTQTKDQSIFAAFSNNVRYWLGQGSYDKSGKFCGDKIFP